MSTDTASTEFAPVVGGLNHLTLQVADLERSLAFWQQLLGCRLRARWTQGAYLEGGNDLWICLSLGQALPARDYTHVALDIEASSVDLWRQRLMAAGTRFWQDNSSEGDSLYCLDPDGHKLELHVGSLETRMAALREAPYAGLVLY